MSWRREFIAGWLRDCRFQARASRWRGYSPIASGTQGRSIRFSASSARQNNVMSIRARIAERERHRRSSCTHQAEWPVLKAWGIRLAKGCGPRKANVAAAVWPKGAVIKHQSAVAAATLLCDFIDRFSGSESASESSSNRACCTGSKSMLSPSYSERDVS